MTTELKAEETLKACPFCGSNNLRIEHGAKSLVVRCLSCGCSTLDEYWVTETKHIKLWNYRAPAKDEGERCPDCGKGLFVGDEIIIGHRCEHCHKYICCSCSAEHGQHRNCLPTAPADEGDIEGMCLHQPCPDHRYGGCYTCPGVLDGEIHYPELPDGTSPGDIIATLQAALAEKEEDTEQLWRNFDNLKAKELNARDDLELAEAKLKSAEALINAQDIRMEQVSISLADEGDVTKAVRMLAEPLVEDEYFNPQQ